MDQPFGEALRSYRIALMLTQEVLGEQALSSAQAVGALKHGADGSRAATVMEKFAKLEGAFQELAARVRELEGTRER